MSEAGSGPPGAPDAPDVTAPDFPTASPVPEDARATYVFLLLLVTLLVAWALPNFLARREAARPVAPASADVVAGHAAARARQEAAHLILSQEKVAAQSAKKKAEAERRAEAAELKSNDPSEGVRLGGVPVGRTAQGTRTAPAAAAGTAAAARAAAAAEAAAAEAAAAPRSPPPPPRTTTPSQAARAAPSPSAAQSPPARAAAPAPAPAPSPAPAPAPAPGPKRLTDDDAARLRREAAERRLPHEPPADDPDALELSIRCVDWRGDSRYVRRFRRTDPVLSLLDFAQAHFPGGVAGKQVGTIVPRRVLAASQHYDLGACVTQADFDAKREEAERSDGVAAGKGAAGYSAAVALHPVVARTIASLNLPARSVLVVRATEPGAAADAEADMRASLSSKAAAATGSE
jgi:hypothetical protein